MAKNKLGTKSTRPIIMQILEKRELIFKANRKYKISELGIFIIEMLEKIWLPFLKPEFTRMIEKLLEDIKAGRKQKEEVIYIFKKLFLELFDRLISNHGKISAEIKLFKRTNVPEKKLGTSSINLTSSKCPFCKLSTMKLVIPKNKRKFLVCLNENCEKKYLSVPNKGSIYIVKKSSCGICGFNIFKINYKKNNKTLHYYLCPYCWNVGFNTNLSRKGFCSKCNNYKIENNNCIEKKI